jgi:hypothetical protein
MDGAIRYGDVFPAVSGGLAKKPVAPQDAATMQSAETLLFGETIKGGPAATMQSASMRNERMGAVAHDQATDATAEQGVSVSETRIPGGRIVTEFVAGQVTCTGFRTHVKTETPFTVVYCVGCGSVPRAG